MSDEDRATGGVDTEAVERIGARLAASNRFETVELRPASTPTAVVAAYDMRYFSAAVERAHLRISWFVTDDSNIHYSEQYADETWDCRWDRHPNDHNTRDHFHPPPDAETPGEDASYANDWRTVLSTLLSELDARIESFWES